MRRFLPRFQFRVSHLLLLVLLISLPFAWVGNRIQQARHEQSAIARLALIPCRFEESGPEWLRNALHCHFPIQVLHVSPHGDLPRHYDWDAYIADINTLTELDRIVVYDGGAWKAKLIDEGEARLNGEEIMLSTDDADIRIRRIREAHPNLEFNVRFGGRWD